MKTTRHTTLFILILILFSLLAACNTAHEPAVPDVSAPPTSTQPQSPGSTTATLPVVVDSTIQETPVQEVPAETPLVLVDIDTFFDTSWREIMLRDPEWVVLEGLADVFQLQGAKLTDISEEYTRETIRLYQATLAELHKYNRDELTPEQQISYDVYEWFLEDQVQGGEYLFYDYPATYYPVTAVHQGIIYFFTDLHPLRDLQDAQDYVSRLEQVDTKITQLLDGLVKREQSGVIPPRFAIQWALGSLQNLTDAPPIYTPFYQTLQEKTSLLSSGTPAEYQAQLDLAEDILEEQVLPAYRELANYLEKQVSVAPLEIGVWQHNNGDQYYTYLLNHYTSTGVTADQVHDLGLLELDRIHQEMRTIFDQLGYPQDESLPQLFDRVAIEGGLVSGVDMLATYDSIIQEASQSLGDAFNIRPQADVIVIKSPIKGMYVPASLEGSRPGVFHAGPGENSEQYYAMPTLAYHEAIPGHHFQIALAQETGLPLFRNVISFTGYAEGWALYAELLAHELGWYADDPYGELGRLQAEAFRAARLVVDTGIHAKGWTFEEAEQFFTENTGFERDDAVNPQYEIARYSVWPGQSTAYKIGMIKILELRQKAQDELGDFFDLKEFHSVLLKNGSMPLEVLERVVDQYIEAQLNP